MASEHACKAPAFVPHVNRYFHPDLNDFLSAYAGSCKRNVT